MEVFHCNTRILSGEGSIARLSQLGIQRLLVVTDPFFMENGVARQVAEKTGAEAWELFSQVRPDPSVELAAEGTAAVQRFHPDTVVALGGGSAIDCAKAMVYFSGEQIRLIAIPTTSGSGSEVTDFAILTHNGVKHPLVDSRLRPEIAILDGDLLKELPPSLIADAGFDVLAHAAEAYVARDAGAITEGLAADAFSAAFSLLPISFGGNREVRQRMHLASCMAGMAFTQAGLGLCHAMAHGLGGIFHLPHGRLNGILLPAVITVNGGAAGAKYARLARAAGLPGSADAVALRNLKNALVKLRKELALPGTLVQAGVSSREIRECREVLIQTVLEDPCCATNPEPVTGELIARVLEEVTGRD